MTETPAVSTAAGFSPTARNRRPKRVRNRIYQVPGTQNNAKYTRIEWPEINSA